MVALSIGKAWEDSVAFVRREVALLLPVALTLVVLPFIVVGQMLPQELMTNPAQGPGMAQLPPAVMAGLLVAGLISLVGSLAIYVLSLQPGVSVGEALQRAGRRLPILLAAAIMVGLGFMILFVLVSALAGLVGLAFGKAGALVLSFVLVAAIILYVSTRMLMLNLVVVDTNLGPVASIRESWSLTRGMVSRLIFFFLTFLFLILLVQAAAQAVFGVVGNLIGGPDVARLLGDLAGGTATGVIQLYFLVMTARIYEQIKGKAALS